MFRDFVEFRLNPSELRFPHHRPAVSSEVRRAAGCGVVFGAEDMEIRFPANMLNWPMKAANPNLRAIVLKHAKRQIIQRNMAPEDFLNMVELRLTQAILGGTPKAQDIAKDLGLSPRSFSRRLQDKNTTFPKLLHGVRINHGTQLLMQTDLSIGEIAFLLGYASQSAFAAAFKHTTGQSPKSARASSRISPT